MTVKHNLTMDFQQIGEPQRIHVTQGDSFTRDVSLTLLSGGKVWEIPQCDILVHYLKSDGTAGSYDLTSTNFLPFGIDHNILDMRLSPVLMDTPGVVQVQVELRMDKLRLGTFPFLIVVEPSAGQEGC